MADSTKNAKSEISYLHLYNHFHLLSENIMEIPSNIQNNLVNLKDENR